MHVEAMQRDAMVDLARVPTEYRRRSSVHQPSRDSRLRIVRARANTVLAVGHVVPSKGVERMDRISTATRTHGSRYGSWFIRSPDPPVPAATGGW
jgi:hypothetical protein